MTPDTGCESVPKEICGPEACPVVRGEDVCRDEVQEVRIREKICVFGQFFYLF